MAPRTDLGRKKVAGEKKLPTCIWGHARLFNCYSRLLVTKNAHILQPLRKLKPKSIFPEFG